MGAIRLCFFNTAERPGGLCGRALGGGETPYFDEVQMRRRRWLTKSPPTWPSDGVAELHYYWAYQSNNEKKA